MAGSGIDIKPLDRVLLIEDNPGDARLIRELLDEAGAPFELHNVTRLSEALERLEAEHFHLILLDLSLPDSQGIDSFERISAQASDIPLIVLTGMADEALALRIVGLGAQDYLVKGEVDRRSLVRSIIYAIKRAAADRALADERNLLRNVIDNLVDSIYVKDLSGRYLLDNEAHRKLVGLPSTRAVVGQKTEAFFPDTVAQQIEEEERRVMATGEPIINREEIIRPRNPGTDRWMAVTRVPLRDRKGEIVGLVGIGREITDRKRAEEQLARYHAVIRKRNVELEEDLHMAREIQQAFLPQQYPTFPPWSDPAQSAIRFCSRYIPTTAVGGDFFHILPISETQAGIFICDVMGHGVRAALVTAIQRAIVEEMLPMAHDPGRYLSEINRTFLSILRRARTPMFASAFYLVVDVGEGVLRYANAGHPGPLHRAHATGEMTFLTMDRPGPALGVFEGGDYQTHSRPAVGGDCVILFTDGLFEVEGADETYFDQNRLLGIFRHHRRAPVETLIDETLKEIRDFALGHVFVDDVCLVGVSIEEILSPHPEALHAR